MCKKLTILILIYILYLKNNEAVVQDFYWRDFIPGNKPEDALELDRKYIGQVYYKGFIPAIVYPDVNLAVAEEHGRQVIKENIKVLCTPFPNRFYWEEVNFKMPEEYQMENAVKGGYQNTYNLYIGSKYHEDEWKIGKVIPIEVTSKKGLRIWNRDGKVVEEREFEILKYDYRRDFNQTTIEGCTQR